MKIAEHKNIRDQEVQIEQIPEAFFIIDSTGNLLDVNNTGCLMLGYEKEELLKLNLRDLIAEDDLKQNPLKFKELREDVPLKFERKVIRKNRLTFEGEVNAQKLANGNLQATLRDITKRKKAERNLKESEKKLTLTLDSTTDMMGLVDINENGEFIFSTANKANRDFIKFLGIDIENYLGAEIKSYGITYLGFTKEEALGIEKIYQKVVKERKPVKVQHDFQDPYGNIFYNETTVNPVFEEDRSIKRLLYVTRDTTEARKAELAIKASEKNLALTLDSATDLMGLVDINEAGEFIFSTVNKANKVMFKTLGIDLKKFLGAELKTFCTTYLGLSKDEALHLEKQYQKAVKKRKTVKVQDSLQDLNGNVFYTETTINPVFGHNKMISQVLVVTRDITETKKTELALKESEKKLALTLDSTTDLMGLADINEKGEFFFTTANKANRELIKQLGIDLKDYFGAEVKAYCTTFLGFTKEKALEAEQIHQQVIKERKPFTTQNNYQDPQGNIYYSETTINPVIEEDGTVKQVLFVTRDTTEARIAEMALVASKKRLASALNSTVDMMGLMEINEKGEFIFNTANRATRESLKQMGIDEKNYFGTELKTYCITYLGFTKEEALELENKYRQVVKKRESIIVLSSSPDQQGNLMHIETTINPVIEENGLVEQVLWVNKDVTEAKKAEEQIKISEQKLNEAQRTAKIGSWELDLNTWEVIWSKEQYRIFEVEEGSPDNLFEVFRKKIHPDDLPKLDELIKDVIENGNNSSYEYRIICNDGSIKNILGISEAVIDTTGKVIGLKGTGQDITYKVTAQKQLLQSIMKGEENERKRLAAELHDGLGQTLSLISLNLDSIINNKNKKASIDEQKMQACLEMVNQTIEDIRFISHGLNPPALKEYGFKELLENMLNEVQIATGILVDFSFDKTIVRFNSDIEINVYRIIQEALNNTIKHAKAQKVLLHFLKKGDILYISYKDNGNGLDLKKSKKAFGGLKNIENRVYVLGGDFSIQSTPKQGITMTIKIPV